VRLAFNLIYTHLLNKTEHTYECDDSGRGLVCADGCTTRRFLDHLEEPLMPWEIAEESRLRMRRMELMRGNIPA